MLCHFFIISFLFLSIFVPTENSKSQQLTFTIISHFSISKIQPRFESCYFLLLILLLFEPWPN